MIKNFKLKIKNFSGFTLIETLVAVAVLAVLMVSVGGIMGVSFKSKNTANSNEALSSAAVFVLEELKKNVLDAQRETITCPIGVGSSISFLTKSGGKTTLFCDSTGRIASASASSGTFYLLDNKVKANNCSNFVACDLAGGTQVLSVGFSLNLGTTNGNQEYTRVFHGIAVPRE